MYKILRDKELKKFIDEFNIEYDEVITSIIIEVSNRSISKYIINGYQTLEIETNKIKKYY